MSKVTNASYETVAASDPYVDYEHKENVAVDENQIMLHVTRTITDHIPLELGSNGFTIGQCVDAHLQAIAKDGQTASAIELEIPPQAWHDYVNGMGGKLERNGKAR